MSNPITPKAAFRLALAALNDRKRLRSFNANLFIKLGVEDGRQDAEEYQRIIETMEYLLVLAKKEGVL